MKKSSLKTVNDRKIILGSNITESEADKMILHLHALNLSAGDIVLKINSRGGSFEASLKLYEAISCSENPVLGLVTGYAFSGAAVILQACTKRYATKNSKILFHNLAYPIDTLITPESDIKKIIEKIQKEIDEIIWKNQTIKKIVCEKTKIKPEEISRFLSEEKKLSAQEAMDYGIIDEIFE